jgi:processive 1,2-diacylglycerol beta-glucosyltransferase
MDEYMAAADLLVGKPGGLTSSEALARGLALVIVHPIPGQEERNADHLLEAGTAIRCNNLPALTWKVDQLLDDPTRLTAMRANARGLARPHAARDIAAALISEPASSPIRFEEEDGSGHARPRLEDRPAPQRLGTVGGDVG